MSPAPVIIFSAAALLLQGCLRPVDEMNLSVPEAYRSAARGNHGKISTGWLSTFKDRDLNGLVVEALKHNLDLKEASANLQAARETRKAARAVRLPSVGLSGSGSRTRRGDGFLLPVREQVAEEVDAARSELAPDGGTGDGGTASLTTVAYGLSMEASWELDLWGRLRDLDKAAEQEYFAAQADFRSARLALAANTAGSWFDLITARLQVALAEKTLESYNSNRRIVERNYKAGDDTASALDVQFARNNVASAERALVNQRLSRDEGARTLEVLLGRYPSAEVRSNDTVWRLYFGIAEGENGLEFVGELPPLPQEIPAGLPSDLLWRRPDLVAAAADLRASARRAGAARKDLLPSINLTGRAATSSDALNRMLTDPEFIVWNAAASLAQTVYRGGAPTAEVRRAMAANEAALQRFASLALRAFREVESALAIERSVAQQEQFLQVELRQAALAEKQSAREYSDGIVGILEILEAQRRAVNARNSMITLRNQRLQNRIDLHLALGGDFATPAPEPEPERENVRNQRHFYAP